MQYETMIDNSNKSKRINELKNKHDFTFSKSLGQNFLIDDNKIAKILEGANIGAKDLIIEIGPGNGALTSELIKQAKTVIAVELDERLIPILEERFSDADNLEIINGDILKVDLQKIIDDKQSEHTYDTVKVIGNLPYYITTPIIMGILEKHITVSSIIVMMQKEVAERIVAKPGTKAYGALSVAVQYYCDVIKLESVPKECFIPRPKVDSEVLRLDVKESKDINIENLDEFFKVVKAGFGMRRKTLLNSLTLIPELDKDKIKTALTSAGIDPIRRAETLTIDEFAKLTEEISKVTK